MLWTVIKVSQILFKNYTPCISIGFVSMDNNFHLIVSVFGVQDMVDPIFSFETVEKGISFISDVINTA